MCGIVGYVGKKSAFPILLSGLKKLEYRGYDSFGVCVLNNKAEPFLYKKAGKISEAEKELLNLSVEGNFGQAHTRWATHGLPTGINAHPHFDCQKEIFVVHNGIIENFRVLRENLKKENHRFLSETDTEVLPHLIEKFFNGNLEKATIRALKLVKGTYALVVTSTKDPQKIVVARKSAPILIGVGRGEFVVASDPSAILGITKKIIYLDDGEVGVFTPSDFFITDLNQIRRQKAIKEIEWTVEEAQKGGYPHFMLKEIMEQPQSIGDALRGRLIEKEGVAKLSELEQVKEKLREIKRLQIISCGTAYFAGCVGKYMLEEYAGIPTDVDLASEFRYRKPILNRETACLVISQSGETADTLAALREAKEKGVLTLGIVNVVGSSIARETEAVIYNHAGPEIAVASTKAFTSQLTLLALLTLFLGRQRQLSLIMARRIARELSQIPKLVKEVLKENDKKIKLIARRYRKFDNFLFLGRKYNFPVALEGALKLKEISYVHAEGYGAGEMKHGPIALIDKNFPTLAICPRDPVYEKMISNIMEIKAREGRVLALASRADKNIKEIADEVIYIPETLEMLTPILSIIPLQLFAYYVGVLRGCDVDKPRNLAKSVTVE